TQVQKTTQGAAGPTAGKSQENLQTDQTGLNFTMTPAEDVLKPPGPSEKQAQKELQKEQKKAREEEKASS
ncbi:MAG TPA: hypothetical protein VF099_05075, partial [Ktedonobacterales bacterium]